MKIKTLIAVLMTCAMLVSMVGCSNESDKNLSSISATEQQGTNEIKNDSESSKAQNANKFDEDLKATNQKKPPNEKFIINDLKKNNVNVFKLNYCDETLNVDSLKITKRKTEGDSDTVYVSAVFKNDDYTVKADITLYYSFYTVGGWVLDYHEITSYKSSANKPFYTNDTFVQFLRENFDDGKIVNRDHGVNGDENYYDDISFSGSLKYNYLTTTITGTYSMVFADDVWYREIVFDGISHDWSKLNGTWKYTHDNGDYIILEAKNVSDIGGEKYSMSYSYSTSSWKWLDAWYNDNMKNYTNTGTFESPYYFTDEMNLLGVDVKVPTYVIMSVDLGSDPSLGNYGVYLDRNDGVILSATEITYNGPTQSKVHKFALKKS